MKIQNIIKRLLKTYEGKKMERYCKLANDLHISPRWVIYLATGEREPAYHLGIIIKQMYKERSAK